MTAFSALTRPQKRQLIAGFASSGTVLEVTVKDGGRHFLILQAVAQDERESEADPYSNRGSLVVARHYASPTLVVLHISDIATLEPFELPITDPRHPDYEAPELVTKPIPVEAMASRKRGGVNRHEQA